MVSAVSTSSPSPQGITVELPNEMLFEIFQRFSPGDLIRCSGVSKQWRHVVLDCGSLWKPFVKIFGKEEWEKIARRHPDLNLQLEDMSSLPFSETIRKAVPFFSDLDRHSLSIAGGPKIWIIDLPKGFTPRKAMDILQRFRFPAPAVDPQEMDVSLNPQRFSRFMITDGLIEQSIDRPLSEQMQLADKAHFSFPDFIHTLVKNRMIPAALLAERAPPLSGEHPPTEPAFLGVVQNRNFARIAQIPQEAIDRSYITPNPGVYFFRELVAERRNPLMSLFNNLPMLPKIGLVSMSFEIVGTFSYPLLFSGSRLPSYFGLLSAPFYLFTIPLFSKMLFPYNITRQRLFTVANTSIFIYSAFSILAGYIPKT